MNRRRKFRTGLGLVAVLSLAAWLVADVMQPLYKGKPVKEWLEGKALEKIGTEDLRAIGPDAIPFLRDRLQTPLSTKVNLAMRRALPQSVARHLPKPVSQNESKLMALECLRFLSEHAEPAIPELLPLITNYTHLNWECELAAKILGNLGPKAKKALPLLEPALTNSAKDMRWSIAYAVWQLGGDTDAVRREVLDLITCEGNDVVLMELARAKPEMAAVFAELVRDPAADRELRLRAAIVTAMLNCHDKAGVGLLRQGISESTGTLRTMSAVGLWRVAPEFSREAVPELRKSWPSLTRSRFSEEVDLILFCDRYKCDPKLIAPHLEEMILTGNATERTLAEKSLAGYKKRAQKASSTP